MSDRRTDEKCAICGSWLFAQGDYRYCPLSGTVGHIRMEQEQRER